MLACAGINRQPEHEPSWAPGTVGRRGGCDRELHADAQRRVHGCQPAVSRATCNVLAIALSANELARVLISMMGRSMTSSNQRPDTLTKNVDRNRPLE